MNLDAVTAPAPGKAATISAQTGITSGRFVISIRHNYLVADATLARGGANEAPGAIELLIASLATCALAVIEDEGRKAGAREASYHVVISATQSADDRTRFSNVDFAFHFTNIEQNAGEALIKVFTDVCPIYNTVARTTPITMSLTVA